MKRIIAAAAVFAALVGQASAQVPYPDWWMTSSTDLKTFAACERVGPAAPGVDPDPARGAVIGLSHPIKADALRYTVHTFGPAGDVEFVRVHYPNGNVNLLAYAEQKQACEAIRAGEITIERLDAGQVK